jgi:hypothetical protein
MCTAAARTTQSRKVVSSFGFSWGGYCSRQLHISRVHLSTELLKHMGLCIIRGMWGLVDDDYDPAAFLEILWNAFP